MSWQISVRRTLLVPLLICLIMGVAFSFARALGVMILPVAIITIVGWIAVLFFGCIRNVFQKRFVVATQYLAVMVIGVPVSLAVTYWAGDYIHLAVLYPIYSQQIERSGGTEQIHWDWGTTGFVGSAQTHRSLVFSPASHPKSEPHSSPESPEITVTHLIGDFYIRTQWWY